MTRPTDDPERAVRATSAAAPRVTRVAMWLLKHVCPGPQLRVWLRADVSGRDALDRVQGAVIVSNHQAFADHLVLPLNIRRPVRFLAKAEYWGRGPKGRLQGLFFTITNQVPVDRDGGSGATSAIDVATEWVRRGELFVIYPEGTRSPDGRIYRGRTGAVRVAIRAGVPIVPSAVVGLHGLQPAGRIIPRRGSYKLLFGDPIQIPADVRADDRAAVRRITDEVMEAIVDLSGLEYVAEYAPRRRRARSR